MNEKQKKSKSKSASKRKVAIKDLKVKGGAGEIKGGSGLIGKGQD